MAESGSFSRAPEHSHVSQPSLSQQILKLEAELGARLFDRLGRTVRLTDAGKTFLPRARAVLHELEAARGDVSESKDSVSRNITVGVIPTVAPCFLPPVVAAFSKRRPDAAVSVVEEITPVLLERLRAGSLDLAILALPVRGHECEAVPLVTEPFFCVAPGQAPASKAQRAWAVGLAQRAVPAAGGWALLSGKCCGGVRPGSGLAAGRVWGNFRACWVWLERVGLSLVPEMAVERNGPVRFVRISDPEAKRTIGALTLRGRSLSRAHHAFLPRLRDRDASR